MSTYSLPLSNDFAYHQQLAIDKYNIRFEYTWNSREQCRFVRAILPDGTVVINNKALHAGGYLGFNFNASLKGFYARLFLIPNTDDYTPPLENWAFDYSLVLSVFEGN